MAYDARDGKKLWEAPTGTGVVAAPVTYLVDGKQYVSIAVGWGGVYGITARDTERKGPGTVYTFAIGGTAKAPDFVAYRMGALLQGVPYDKKHVARARRCTSATASSAMACRASTAAATFQTWATLRRR